MSTYRYRTYAPLATEGLFTLQQATALPVPRIDTEVGKNSKPRNMLLVAEGLSAL